MTPNSPPTQSPSTNRICSQTQKHREIGMSTSARLHSIAVFLVTLFAIVTLSSPLRARRDGESTLLEDDLCVYTVYISTGSVWSGGTDAVIGVKLCGAAAGECLSIADLEAWGGLMSPGHDYFEWGSVDAFSGRARCLASPPCSMELLSDGSGPGHGWYCEYVQVATTGPQLPCTQRTFKVQQWLANDAPPYKLLAVRDECGGDDHKNQTEKAVTGW